MTTVELVWLIVDISSSDPSQWTYKQTPIAHTSGTLPASSAPSSPERSP